MDKLQMFKLTLEKERESNARSEVVDDDDFSLGWDCAIAWALRGIERLENACGG